MTELSTGPERQQVTLSTGEQLSPRLVVLANGLNVSLRHSLGIEREIVSPCHSVSSASTSSGGPPDLQVLGHDLLFGAHRRPDRLHHLVPDWRQMRANLMTYRDMQDPWLRQFRQAPEETLKA